METTPTDELQEKPRHSGKRTFLIVLATIIVTAGLTYWVLRTWVFPSEFTPVKLSISEEQVLNKKLERLDSLQTGNTRGSAKARKNKQSQDARGEEYLEPEAYSEEGADRSISLTERELNSLVAKNTDLARKLAIDLSDNLMSARLLIPVDEDFPIMGGQILKVRAGVELAYRESRPIVVLKGVSIMGVPVPNAWLGGLKNIDLVEQYGTDAGFWKAFADGVEHINVEDGSIRIQLKE
jgi:hypothetical protein